MLAVTAVLEWVSEISSWEKDVVVVMQMGAVLVLMKTVVVQAEEVMVE